MSLLRQQTIRRLRRGHTIHMEMQDGVKTWWFESPYAEVDPMIMASIFNSRRLPFRMIGLGDSLFGADAESQTWQAIRRDIFKEASPACN